MCTLVHRLRELATVSKLPIQSGAGSSFWAGHHPLHRVEHRLPSHGTPRNEWELSQCPGCGKQGEFNIFGHQNESTYRYTSQVFTSIFTFECIVKLMALSKDFFLCGWNIFDLLIVTASLLDIIFELVDGLSVLRGLRLVTRNRYFKDR